MAHPPGAEPVRDGRPLCEAGMKYDAFLDEDHAEVGRRIERQAVAEELFRRHEPGDPALRQALGALLDSGGFQRGVLDEWRAMLGG